MKTLVVACIFAASISPAALGATRTWTGSASGNWSFPFNWNPVGSPSAGDDLVFPSGAMNLAMTNDIPAPAPLFLSLTFSGSGYSASGNAVSLLGGISATHASGATTLAFDVAVSSATFTVSSSLASLAISGNISVTSTLTAAGAGTQTYSGVLSGAGGLALQSGGPQVTLSAANTYGGNTFVSTGVLTLQNATALGTTGNGTTLGGGTLRLAGSTTIAGETLTVSNAGSALVSLSGTNHWSGPITLNASLAIVLVSVGTFHVQGNMSGTGGLAVDAGSGIVVLSGNNSYSGPVTFVGALEVDTATALGTSATPVTCGVSGGSALELGAGVTVPNGLDLTNAGCFLWNTTGNNTWSGPIQTPAAARRDIVVNAGTTLTVTGEVSALGFTKKGTGTLVIADSPNASGDLQAGTTLVNQRLDAATLVPGATLGGGGVLTVVDASAGGTIFPGQIGSPGILSAVTLTLGAMATLAVEIDGAASFSTLRMDGGTLGGATLAGTLNFSPSMGTTFKIVDNITGNPINGTFAGLPENAYLRFANTDLRISYVGGDGNDVVLTVIAPPVATIGAGGSTSFCPPGSVMLTALPTGGTGSYASYQWYLNGVAVMGAVLSTFNASTPGSYTVTVTDSVGVVSAASAPIVVGDSTAPTVNAPAAITVTQTLCQ